MGVRHAEMMTTSLEPAIVALLSDALRMRRVKQSSLEIVFHYRCRRGDRRFAGRHRVCFAKLCKKITAITNSERARKKMRDESEEAMRREIFSRASHSRDFSTGLHACVSIIFLLTSFRVDSIHQLVATKHRC